MKKLKVDTHIYIQKELNNMVDIAKPKLSCRDLQKACKNKFPNINFRETIFRDQIEVQCKYTKFYFIKYWWPLGYLFLDSGYFICNNRSDFENISDIMPALEYIEKEVLKHRIRVYAE